MPIKPTYQHAVATLFKNPYVWGIALIATVGDVWAVLAYNPALTRLTFGVFLFTLVSMLAEAGLIYAYVQNLQGKRSGLVDALMTAVSYLPPLLAIKIVPIIIFSGFIIFLSVMGPLVFIVEGLALKIILASLITAVSLTLLFFLQGWSFFAICDLYKRESSLGETFSHAWHLIWHYKWTVLKLCLPLILLDALLIGLLLGAGAITYESTFHRLISSEEADRSALLVGEGGGAFAGVEITVNRLANSVLVMGFKNRGVELASVPFLITDNVLAGVATAVISLVLILIRASVLTQAYFRLTTIDIKPVQAPPPLV